MKTPPNLDRPARIGSKPWNSVFSMLAMKTGKPRDNLRKCSRAGKSSRKFHELWPSMLHIASRQRGVA